MLRPIRFQCVWDWISTELRRTHICSWSQVFSFYLLVSAVYRNFSAIVFDTDLVTVVRSSYPVPKMMALVPARTNWHIKRILLALMLVWCAAIFPNREKSLQSSAAKKWSSFASAARAPVTKLSPFSQLKMKLFTLLLQCVFSVDTCNIYVKCCIFNLIHFNQVF